MSSFLLYLVIVDILTNSLNSFKPVSIKIYIE